MNFSTKFLSTSLTILVLMGCESDMEKLYSVDVEVKHNSETMFESTASVKEETLYKEEKENCKLTLLLSKANEVSMQIESELECFKGALTLTPSFVVREGESATLEVGEENNSYSYSVRVTENAN
ncbi:hypothetical protein [Pseudoalteromonas sp. NCIMB_1079]|uniref:hypothetical protein n=1 Tax=Pseudoalteromonas sp. NCIMB 1079 TaxID=3142847 RepID=UPI00339C08F9|eukprot:TRINITY_DN4439_c0_g1_i1.p1 TRINITY_DN4439_c0_g1~~TRINITY_DN4439_c0_g1_i1.p1  ORF type:complete len:125 (+),score=15.68 TRINITY_DN4439_c0_g1_i1:343-717(+)